MKEFLLANWIGILTALFGLGMAIYQKRWGDIKLGLTKLISQAELAFNPGENKEKMAHVIEEIYTMFPKSKILKLIPKRMLIKTVNAIVAGLKEYTGGTNALDNLNKQSFAVAEKLAIAQTAEHTEKAILEMEEKLKSADFFGDKNLVSNQQVEQIKAEVLKKNKLEVIAKLLAETDFTKKGNKAVAGVEIKF